MAAIQTIVNSAITSKKHVRYFPRGEVVELISDQTDEGSTFFDNFNYFTGYDPSQGFVQ